MTTTTKSSSIAFSQEWVDLLNHNSGKLKEFFTHLLNEHYHNDLKATIGYFLRHSGYAENSIPKLLELAEDYKRVNQAAVDFIDKYEDELFLAKAAEYERKNIQLLDSVIEHLTELEVV